MTLQDAKQLKDNFPKETEGFNIFQVNQIWLEYSYSLAATWINPTQEDVERVFGWLR